MLTDREHPHDDWVGQPLDLNWECEFCGRSIESRFGGVPTNECDSCSDEFSLLYAANKIVVMSEEECEVYERD